MKVLDLFSGLGGWSQAFLDRGHDVLRIDNDEHFRDVPRTKIGDILTFTEPRDYYDVILASPPCQAFSLASGGHMRMFGRCRDHGFVVEKVKEKWRHPGGPCAPRPESVRLVPVSDFGKLSIRLVQHTLDLIDLIEPSYWWMENPNGGMIHFVPEKVPRVQVTYCRYGESRMKLTNLWGNWPSTWTPRPRCKNGDPCHEAAPRGAKTGTQGITGAAQRALVPYELSLEVCLSVEEALARAA